MTTHVATGKITLQGTIVVKSDRNYVASGGLSLASCVDVSETKFIIVKFEKGAVVYEARLARKGRLEKLVVKNINIINNKNTFGLYAINYVDTLNAVYIEEELVDHATALALAEAYLEAQQASAVQLAKDLCAAG